MTITILMGSPRKGGNTDLLVQAFAKESNNRHNVEVINICDYDIHPCKGCNYCFNNEENKCCQKDDMKIVYDKLAQTDMLVIASPVYFYGISAQLKTVIDRLHNPVRNRFGITKMALFAVGAASLPTLFDAIITQYQLCLKFFNIEDAGTILVRNVKEKGDILNSQALNQAKELGLTI